MDSVYTISYSQLKLWNACPFHHKLVKIDKIKKDEGSIHTAFGTAIHSVSEELLKESLEPDPNMPAKARQIFQEAFERETATLPLGSLSEEDKQAFLAQGSDLAPEIIPALHRYFPGFKVFSREEELRSAVDGVDGFDFLGYVDLVLEISEGQYVILDWKTTSWGWEAEKKSNTLTTYQPTLYKHFWCKKHNIPPECVETYFGLLKRTAKKDKVEIFRSTSGKIKTNNALDLLKKACMNIKNKMFVKNRTSCMHFADSKKECPFFKTEHCW